MPLVALLAALSLGSPVGTWSTAVDKAQVRVEACGTGLCGFVLASTPLAADPDQKDVHNDDAALRARPMRDMKILEVQPSGGQWKGWVYDPRSGHTYRVRLRMRPGDRLELTGCLIGPLCGSQTWSRAGGG